MKLIATITWFVATAIITMSLRAEAPPRPDLSAVAPLASCKLQAAKNPRPAANAYPTVGLYAAPVVDDPLVNYQRTPLGDWPMPADAERSDPWLRLLLLTPRRPVVIDVAIFIEGKPFRERREAWIDDVLASSQGTAVEAETQPEVGDVPVTGAGTISADAASNVEAPAGNGGAGEEKRLPGVPAQSRQAPTMHERLKNYLAVVGTDFDREEVRWLLAESGLGPSLVVLSASRSWERATLAPLLAYLDQDGEGSLSATEVQQAESLLRHADFNGDDVVEVAEIRRAIRQAAPPAPLGSAHPLVVMLDGNTDWVSLAGTLERIYPQAETAAGLRLEQMRGAPAEIAVRLDLSAEGGPGATPGLALISVADELGGGQSVSTTEDVISVGLGGEYVEFAAARSEATGPAVEGQIALGAVIDGNPLLRLLDRDQDGRLTLRERQELPGLLVSLDRDGDGQLGADEIPTPIRFAVTNGPHVHEILATPTGAARAIGQSDAPQAPDWFLSMDSNKDGDLSRNEFLGTTEQFRQFDENGDDLLSIAEALKLKLESE